MSFYAMIQGNLKYDDKEEFELMVQTLKGGGWIDEQGYFVDESGSRVKPDGASDIDKDKNVIIIPRFTYRNLGRLDFSGEWSGVVSFSSTDGCSECWAVLDGLIEETMSFDIWGYKKIGDKPLEEEFADEDDYYENLYDWENKVHSEFHSSYHKV